MVTIVVPYIGTWIETTRKPGMSVEGKVVPYIGTWIETIVNMSVALILSVVPYIGTWIETRTQSDFYKVQMSYLIQVRGLKQIGTAQMIMKEHGRTLYRYVD